MSGGGLSKSRLARMRDVMAGYVERGEVPGLVRITTVHIQDILRLCGRQRWPIAR